MKRFPLLALLALTAIGCVSDPLRVENEPVPAAASAQVHPQLGAVFQLRPGEVASVSDGALLVAFQSVASDSRCPVDVACVWAGDAELIIGVASEGGPWSWSVLHTGIEPRSRSVRGFSIEVADLEPAPRTDTPVSHASYAIHLRITRD